MHCNDAERCDIAASDQMACPRLPTDDTCHLNRTRRHGSSRSPTVAVRLAIELLYSTSSSDRRKCIASGYRSSCASDLLCYLDL